MRNEEIASGQNFVYHATVHVGQSIVTASVTIGQFCVIQTKQMQNRRMKIMNVNRILSYIDSVLVRFAVGDSRLYSCTCQPR